MADKSSNAILWLSGAIVVAAVVIGGAILYTKPSSGTPSGTGNPSQNGQPQTAAAVDINAIKLQGEPITGNANAPVTIAVFEDYQCPFCQKLEQDSIAKVYSNYVATGKVKMVFKDWEFLGPDSQTLGKFARAAWDVAPDKFYQWRKAIFDAQGTENTGWATQAKIMSITTGVLGAGDAAKVLSLYQQNGDKYQQAMDADKTEGTALGINGTPDVVVGKQLIVGAVPYATIQTAIDAQLNGK